MSNALKWVEQACGGMGIALSGGCPNDHNLPCPNFECAWIGKCYVHEFTTEDHAKIEAVYASMDSEEGDRSVPYDGPVGYMGDINNVGGIDPNTL